MNKIIHIFNVLHIEWGQSVILDMLVNMEESERRQMEEC